MTSRPLAARTVASLCLAGAAVLVGCANTTRTVQGHVIAGEASVVTVVPAADPRLATPGLPDVTVRVTKGDGTPTPLAETTTGPDGSFTLSVDTHYIYNRLELTAEGPALVTCHGSVYLPTDDRCVLVFVEPNHSQGVGERSR